MRELIYVDGKLDQERTDKATIMEDLASNLFHKKIMNCKYITKIVERQTFLNDYTITVYMNNGVKVVYEEVKL